MICITPLKSRKSIRMSPKSYTLNPQSSTEWGLCLTLGINSQQGDGSDVRCKEFRIEEQIRFFLVGCSGNGLTPIRYSSGCVRWYVCLQIVCYGNNWCRLREVDTQSHNADSEVLATKMLWLYQDFFGKSSCFF